MYKNFSKKSFWTQYCQINFNKMLKKTGQRSKTAPIWRARKGLKLTWFRIFQFWAFSSVYSMKISKPLFKCFSRSFESLFKLNLALLQTQHMGMQFTIQSTLCFPKVTFCIHKRPFVKDQPWYFCSLEVTEPGNHFSFFSAFF